MERINQWLMIGANVGVLIGIVFLAFEVRQNTAQMRAEASYSIHQDVQRLNESVYGDSDLSRLLIKADEHYAQLDADERSRVEAYYFSEINLADFVMGLEQEGLSDVLFRTQDVIIKKFGESPGRRAFIGGTYKRVSAEEIFVRSERLHNLLLAE